jgi:CheY-like chemotaxis protein
MNTTKFVLVVEDDDDIREMIVSSLKAESAELSLTVVEARDGREAIQLAGRQEFHCVVTDLNMPRTSGQELIRVLLGEALNANTPTVVVSAGVDDSFLADFQGVRTVTKPFDPVALSQMVLREIKLGRMDERVPVHMLNPFAESLRSTLLQEPALGAVQVLPPTVRRSGEKFLGDLVVGITLTTGMMQTRMSFSFDRSFLLQMKTSYFSSRRDQWAAMNLELLARACVTLMMENALPALISVFGQPPRIAEMSVTDLSDPVRLFEISRSPGVSIALGTDQGRVFISALAPARAKRGNA